MIDIIWHIIQKVVCPKHWIQLESTNYTYSKKLNEALDDPTTKIEKGYLLAYINGVEVWIGNYPYAYGSLHNGSTGLPTVQVRRKLKRKIDEINPFEEGKS